VIWREVSGVLAVEKEPCDGVACLHDVPVKTGTLFFVMALGLVLNPLAYGQDEAKKPGAKKRGIESLQESLKPDRIVTYRKVGDRELTLHIFQPEGFQASGKAPVFVAIHGGGWVGGTPSRFYPYAHALVAKGYVGISVEYRLANEKGLTVFDCVKDGRAAIRYIRAHAAELGIDPARIAVCGGSAGAHVAAGAALFDGIDHEGENLAVSCRPDALILYFPVIDTSNKGYGNAKIGKDWETISPVDRVKPGAPPTLVFHGDADKTTPYAGSVRFTEEMAKAGNVCELVTQPGGGHGHLNADIKLFDAAMARTAEFLAAHLKGK
jgi:acetyl esterase